MNEFITDSPSVQYYIDLLADEYHSRTTGDKKYRERKIKYLNKHIPAEFKNGSMNDFAENADLLQILTSAGKEGAILKTALNELFSLAQQDNDEICSNPAELLSISRVNDPDDIITDEEYRQLIDAILAIPSATIFGIAAFLNIDMATASIIRRPDIDLAKNTVYIVKSEHKICRIYEQDGKRLLKRAIEIYDQRMEDPEYAEINEGHLVFTNKYGDQYSSEDTKTICEFVRSKCSFRNANLAALRRYILNNRL